MALGQAVSGDLAIGLGCRRGCPAGVLVALVESACVGLDRYGARLVTIDRKRDEPGMLEAARLLELQLMFVDAEQLTAVAGQVGIRSARVAAVMGVPSIAEAAALVGAGEGARLIVPRVVSEGATCAVARAP
jgi:cobalt-precorrin 5A hydrolase